MRKRATLLVCGLAAAAIVVIVCMILVNAAQTPQVHAAKEALATLDIATSTVQAPPPPAEVLRSPDEQVDAAEPSGSGQSDPITVNVPQLAYSYKLGYRLAGSAIVEAQQSHLALCRRLGPGRCQLLSMERSSNDDGDSDASLKLRVASSLAATFSTALTKAITNAGGRAADTNVTAEDVSKQVVDTDARLRQREILVARLTAMLRNRPGKVSELVEAERSVAQAQEELDQAKGWLRELRGRVAFSDFEIDYVPVTAIAPSPHGFAWQLRDAVMQSDSAVVTFVRTLLMLVIYLLPWVAIAAPPAWWLLAKRRKRQPMLTEA